MDGAGFFDFIGASLQYPLHKKGHGAHSMAM
jgi:hypothetical protein